MRAPRNELTRIAFSVIFATVAALGLVAADAVPAPRPTVASLTWLSGAWSFERNGRAVTEQWMAPSGGTMPGMSRTVANGKTVAYEFLLLREEANGDIFYIAKPSGQPEAMFKLVRVGAREVVFENLEHDFPQRILYTLQDDGTLLAAIEGTRNGRTRRVEFPYRRSKP